MSIRGVNYRAYEDKSLCEAWLEVSGDGGTGINQSGDEFYGRVKEVFEAILRAQDKFVSTRVLTSLRSRFQTISATVSKFVGCHARVTALELSGRSVSDTEHEAIELYESDRKNGRFKFMQCWKILKDSDKWGAWRSGIQEKRTPSKRTRSSIEAEHNSDPVTSGNYDEADSEEVNTKRPRGQQKSKLERANLALYARQVQATERMAKNSEIRNKVAREQVENNLFSMQPGSDDEDMEEYVALKRKIVLARLRKEAAAEAAAATDATLRSATSRTGTCSVASSSRSTGSHVCETEARDMLADMPTTEVAGSNISAEVMADTNHQAAVV